MKRFFLKATATVLCFFATAGLATAEEAEHRLLDPLILKSLDQSLINKQRVEIEKRYPKMIFRQEMMTKMAGEMTLQSAMQGIVMPTMMNMTMGMLDEENGKDQGNGKDQQGDLQETLKKLREQVVTIQQDAMNEIHAQAPNENQMRENAPGRMAGSLYLQNIFMPRQRERTIVEFHSGFFVRNQMKVKPAPLPGRELAHLQLHPKKPESKE